MSTIALPKALDVVQDCGTVYDAMALQRYRTAAVLTHYYGVGQMAGYIGANDYDSTRASVMYRALTSMSHQNAMAAVLETRLAQTVRVPDLRVQTLGGNYSRQRSARKIGQWLSGGFRRNGFGPMLWQSATDAATNPLGSIRVWYDDVGLALARVRPDQIVYNPREGKRPAQLWLHYGLHRSKVQSRVRSLHIDEKEKKKLLSYVDSESAPQYKEDPVFRSLDLLAPIEADEMDIVEHWILPQGGEEDGVYTIACGEEVLNPGEKARTWRHPFFPVVELTDFPSFNSFGGRSLGEQLLPYQLTINRMTRTTEQGQERLAKGRVFMPIGAVGAGKAGAPTERQQFSRTAGEFIDFNPAWGRPEIVAGQAFSPEWYQRQDKVELAMWELAGVDRQSGTGSEPASMADASGKARRERSEAVSARQKRFTDQLDDFVERLCRVALAMAVDHFSGGGETEAGERRKRRRRSVEIAAGTEVLDEVRWKDLDIRETDGVLVRCVGVSGLPNHPSARLEYAKEGYEAGFWNKTYAVKLLAQPDMERAEDSATAAFDLATFHIEGALFDGKRFTPEPHREYLEVLTDIGRRELMRALRLGVDDNNAELLRTSLDIADKMLAGMAPAQPAPAVPGATPPPVQVQTPAVNVDQTTIGADASLGALQ